MSGLETDTVPIFIHDKIADEPVDTTGVPFIEGLAGETIPVVVTHVNGGSDDILASPSDHHGRSYIVNLAEITQGSPGETPVWTDQHDNPFTTLSTKGNNFSRPALFRSATAPSGFIPYGLQEGDALLRVLRASRILRAIGVDTEWPVLITEPKELIYKGDPMSQGEYKQRFIADLVKDNTPDTKKKDPRKETLDTKEISEMAVALKGMEFFITVRATSTADRLWDIANAGTLDKAKLNTAISAYNLLAPRRRQLLDKLGLPETLEPASMDPTEIGEAEAQYFSEVIAKSVGHYLGLMHEAGLVHTYPHIGNITSLGGLVDLDSVKGEPLDLSDEATNYYHEAADLKQVVGDITEHLIGKEKLAGRISIIDRFCQNLMDQYMATRGLDDECSSNPTNYHILDSFIEDHRGIFDKSKKLKIRSSTIVERAVPGAIEIIYQEAEKIFTGINQKHIYVSPLNAAKFMYWSCVDRNMGTIFDEAIQKEDDEWRLREPGEFPSYEDIENAMVAYVGLTGKDASGAQLKQAATRPISFLMLNLGKRCHEKIKKIIRRQVNTTAGNIVEEFYPRDSKDYLIAYNAVKDQLNIITASKAVDELPAGYEIEPEIRKVFREKYLMGDHFAPVPSQDLLTIGPKELKDYKMCWECPYNGMTYYYSNVPKSLVDSNISPTVAAKTFSTSEEVLRNDFDPKERICLVLTDGAIDDYREEFEDDEGNELPTSYLQYSSKAQEAVQATYALFLIRDEDGGYRAEYNTLETNGDR